jgi:putative ABC transport system permease protein
MHGLRHDLTCAIRLLGKNPGFTLIAVVALAFGVGASTGIFSVADAVLLRPLPYPEPDRLAMVWSTVVARGEARSLVTPPDYRVWREESRSLAELGAFDYTSLDLTVPGEEPSRVQGARVTASLFPTLGIGPAIGRGFTPEEEEEGRDRVALISDGLWRRRFGADPELVGRTIRLSGISRVVVGVMPPGMAFLDEAPSVDVWVPLAFAPGDVMNTRNNYFLFVVGRLAAGATLATGNSY